MKPSIRIKVDRREIDLPIEDILYIQAKQQYVLIMTVHKKLLVLQSLLSMLKKLEGYGFYQVHRSYLVPLSRIKSFNGFVVEVEDMTIPVSRREWRTLRNVLAQSTHANNMAQLYRTGNK